MTVNMGNRLGRRILQASLCIAVFIVVYLSTEKQNNTSSNLTAEAEVRPRGPMKRNYNRCPGVLEHMTQGHWKTRKLSKKEQTEVERFYQTALRHLGVPDTLQRPDGRCGNIGYDHVTHFIRAMCNPIGPTPCCYFHKCARKNTEQCQCKYCFDLRQQIHAEYSTWIPSDARCKPRQYSSKQSCELLDGGSVHFIGDSLIRHMYTGFLMTLRGNFKDGGLMETESKEWKSKCSGMDMFEEGSCRKRLDSSPVNECRGKVTVSFETQVSSRNVKDLLFEVTKKLGVPRTLFVVGVGIHNDYNITAVQDGYLTTTINMLQKSGIQWPKILFVDTHAPGIQKTPGVQAKPSVLRYNKAMEMYLNSYNIPVMKTFNMTDGVRSFDGTHYTLGANAMKARILLNYIEELINTGQW